MTSDVLCNGVSLILSCGIGKKLAGVHVTEKMALQCGMPNLWLARTKNFFDKLKKTLLDVFIA